MAKWKPCIYKIDHYDLLLVFLPMFSSMIILTAKIISIAEFLLDEVAGRRINFCLDCAAVLRHSGIA